MTCESLPIPFFLLFCFPLFYINGNRSSPTVFPSFSEIASFFPPNLCAAFSAGREKKRIFYDIEINFFLGGVTNLSGKKKERERERKREKKTQLFRFFVSLFLVVAQDLSKNIPEFLRGILLIKQIYTKSRKKKVERETKPGKKERERNHKYYYNQDILLKSALLALAHSFQLLSTRTQLDSSLKTLTYHSRLFTCLFRLLLIPRQLEQCTRASQKKKKTKIDPKRPKERSSPYIVIIISIIIIIISIIISIISIISIVIIISIISIVIIIIIISISIITLILLLQQQYKNQITTTTVITILTSQSYPTTSRLPRYIPVTLSLPLYKEREGGGRGKSETPTTHTKRHLSP